MITLKGRAFQESWYAKDWQLCFKEIVLLALSFALESRQHGRSLAIMTCMASSLIAKSMKGQIHTWVLSRPGRCMELVCEWIHLSPKQDEKKFNGTMKR
jgi:hypothetical protein